MRVLIDTDLGDDIDDAIAIALAAVAEDVQLIGVTTVFGDVRTRARHVAHLLHAAGVQVPVGVGLESPRSSLADAYRTRRHADQLLENFGRYESMMDRKAAVCVEPAIDLIIESCLSATEETALICIGPCTNLAEAIRRCPAIATAPIRVIAMAGEFEVRSQVEHNARCDPESLDILLRCGIRLDLIPWSLGHDLLMGERQVLQLDECERPVCKLLRRMIDAWSSQYHPSGVPRLFDPLTIALLTQQALFKMRRGIVSIDLAPGFRGRTHFMEGEGRHRVAWGVQGDQAVRWMMTTLTSPNGGVDVVAG